MLYLYENFLEDFTKRGNMGKKVVLHDRKMQKTQQFGIKPMVLIFNNQTFRDYYGVVPYIKESEVCYEGYPHLVLLIIPESASDANVVDKFNGEQVEIRLLDQDNEFICEVSGNLKRTNSPLMPDMLGSKIRLTERLSRARYAQVCLHGYGAQVKISPYVKVYGKITDFHDNPRKNAYVMLVRPYGFPAGTAITKTDEDGFYQMRVPAATYHHAFVCDGDYGRETLEFYGWNVVVKPPEFRLNARFDKIEIYRLTAAETPERTVIVEFVPMDIAHTVSSVKRIFELKGKIDPEDACNEELLPKLDKNNVKVYLDDEELEILTFSQIYYLPKNLGIECLRPAYILEAKIPMCLPPGIYNLKVVVHKNLDDTEECGESILFGLKIW